jgi:hypothetical protein
LSLTRYEVFVKLRTVKTRALARWACAVAACGASAAVACGLFLAQPAGSAVTSRIDRLPACAAGHASTTAPSGPAGPDAPGACRAEGHVLESGVRLSQPAENGFTPPGYLHLGANTGGDWSGVAGRISVVHSSVRPHSYDFVASRFMAKRNIGGGKIAWLEAGWAETGWAGTGAQHIYTFNTNTNTWQFYDQYALRPGDRVWVDLHGDVDGVWGAWLWWNNRWNLLTAQALPIGPSATIEQYVEVHVDPTRPTRINVPTVTVDNVQLRPAGGGLSQFWRADVPTLTGVDPGQPQRSGGFCLNWVNLYDTWTAGDCPAETGGGIFTTSPAKVAPAGSLGGSSGGSSEGSLAGSAAASPVPPQIAPSSSAPSSSAPAVVTPPSPSSVPTAAQPARSAQNAQTTEPPQVAPPVTKAPSRSLLSRLLGN